jgi:amino acid transporter
MLEKIKHLLIGSPLPTTQIGEKKLNKVKALAAFSPDALSSIAYANQEIFLGLVIAGSAGLNLAWPIGMAITAVLAIAALSYYQTIHAYPSGGGSYVVARANLGTIPGLIAGSALLISYILTAAVSLTAGVEAIASAFPIFWSYRIEASLILLLLITLLNLRGLQETGTIMAVPVYLFLATYLPMLGLGMIKWIQHGTMPLASVAPNPVTPISLFLVLHAFSAGCTALTGIESISNGVPTFKRPEARNAGITLVVMAVLMGVLFLGSIGLTQYLAIIPRSQETILSALARQILGNGPPYFIVQTATLLILAVAANTSFAGFPRITAILASDGFLPRQLTGLGDRLVYSNGIILLSLATAILIIVFRGDSHALVPLFAVGAFLAFTLSQAGMVRYWRREKSQAWSIKALINGIGAIATGITFIVIAISKFLEGAWITIGLIGLFVFVFLKIQHHYVDVAQQLSLKGLPPSLRPTPSPRIIIPISGVHRGIIEAVDFARGMSNQVTAFYAELEPGSSAKVRAQWERWFPDVPLVVQPSPYRSIVGPLLDFLDKTDEEHNDGQLAVVILPEFIPAKWWHALLHNQTTWLLKTALLYRRRHLGFQRIIIDIPYHLRK